MIKLFLILILKAKNDILSVQNDILSVYNDKLSVFDDILSATQRHFVGKVRLQCDLAFFIQIINKYAQIQVTYTFSMR